MAKSSGTIRGMKPSSSMSRKAETAEKTAIKSGGGGSASQSASEAKKVEASGIKEKIKAIESDIQGRLMENYNPKRTLDDQTYVNKMLTLSDGEPETGKELRRAFKDWFKQGKHDDYYTPKIKLSAYDILAQKEALRQAVSIAKRVGSTTNLGIDYGQSRGGENKLDADVIKSNGMNYFFAKQSPKQQLNVLGDEKGNAYVAVGSYDNPVRLDRNFKNGVEAVKYLENYVNGRVKNEKWKKALGW